MRSVTVRLDDLRNLILNLGFVGENEHKQFRFDSMKMFGEYPNASVSMTVCPPEGDAYPATIERDGDFVIWTITDSDLVADGDGEIQITFTESPHIAKTYIGRTKTSRSLVPTGDIPSGLDDFITRADALLDQVEEAFPTGGTTGQVLAKKSDADFDTEWVNQGSGGTTDYADLTNKPQIGGVTLTGNKTLHDLGAAAESDIPDPTAIIDDTAGSGDTDKVWSADKSSALLTEIDSILNGGSVTVESVNRLNPQEIQNSTGLKTNGTTESNSGHWVTGYIEINQDKSSVAFTGNNSQGTARVCLPISRLCFYSQSKTFVSKVDSISSNTITAIPDNVAYVRMDIIDAYSSRSPMVEFVDLIGDISSAFVEYQEGTITTPGFYDLVEEVSENTGDIGEIRDRQEEIDAVIPYGLTWDWWISANSMDAFGNAYIGYIDSDAYAGVLRRQPDGTMQYKRLEASWNDDDHNGMATIVLDSGKILVIGSHGHAQDNHIICYRSTEPYSIDNMEELSFDIPETGDYTYNTTYSQIFKYDGKLFDFMRVSVQEDGSTITNGTGYLCLISSDDGETWTAYKAIQSSDPYIAFAQSTDDENIIKGVYTNNPGTRPANMIKGFTFDMDTYEFADLSGTKIGELVLLNGGVIADNDIAHYSDMTDLVQRGESNKSCRLFYVANTPTANTTFLYAIAEDSTNANWDYKMYQNGTVIDIGESGVPFGNNTYISGACFGKDTNTAYYAKATTAKADGGHELHKVIISSGDVESDSIITEASICIIRPLNLGNGEIAVCVGHYNDQNSDGTYKCKYTNWQLKPLFIHASSGGGGGGSDLPSGEGVEF